MTTDRAPMNHELKTWPQFYSEIVAGRKRYEIRKDDRDFHVGDTLTLVEWDPKYGMPTGEHCVLVISYLMRDFPGIEKGYCLMSIATAQTTEEIHAVRRNRRVHCKGDADAIDSERAAYRAVSTPSVGVEEVGQVTSAGIRTTICKTTTREAVHCKTDVCQAASVDGVVCPDDSCDLGNGTRTWEQIAKAKNAQVTVLRALLAAARDAGRSVQREADALKKERDQLTVDITGYRQGVDAVMAKLKPNLSNDMPWEDEVIICHENVVQDAAEETALRERLSDLLTRTANALKGQPLPLVAHDWSDLPTIAGQLRRDLHNARDNSAGIWKQTALDITAERDAAVARAEQAEALSVTKVMLDIVPGDGDGHEVYAKTVREVEEKLAILGERAEEAESKAKKLQAFKDFVHRRFDEIGITKEPNGPHSAEGCRVGDRIDEVAYLRQAAINVLAVIDNGEKDRVQPYNVYATIRTHLRHALKVPA